MSKILESKYLKKPLKKNESKPNPNLRVIIEQVQPCIDCGKFPIKRVVNDKVQVTASIFTDGQDEISAYLLYKNENDEEWQKTPLTFLENDQSCGEFQVLQLGCYQYTPVAWIDEFKTWVKQIRKKIIANQNVAIDITLGKKILQESLSKSEVRYKPLIEEYLNVLNNKKATNQKYEFILNDEFAKPLYGNLPSNEESFYEPTLRVSVDRSLANFGAWYEIFPRSWGENRHGTFKDVINRLDYIQEMGFDILSLTPVHPIGTTYRKGKNNSINADPLDLGSPWAIGNLEGGHCSIHPDLGSVEDFRALLKAAKTAGWKLLWILRCNAAPIILT